ncbi:MAG: YdcF family protein, partial [Rhodocyclaceae bacterium]
MEFYPLLFAKRLADSLTFPPMGPILIALLGTLIAGRLPRFGRILFWLGMLSTVFLTTPFAAGVLMRHLENIPPVDLAVAKTAQAIVVLGGGAYRHAPEYRGDTVSPGTLQRLRYGARLAKQTGLPVLVTGGAPSGGNPVAFAMQDSMENDFGVPAKWIESASLDTRENARFSWNILSREKIRRIVLVTDVSHMRRARLYFATAGFDVIAAPTNYSAPNVSIAYDFMPSEIALRQSSAALHEWLGLAA